MAHLSRETPDFPWLGRNSGVTSPPDYLVGTLDEEICPCVGRILDACAGSTGPGAWWRCRLGRRIGCCGVRSGGRGRGRRGRVYRWTVHCSLLGNQKVRLEESFPGEIPRGNIAKSCDPKYDRDRGKSGDNRNREGFSATQAGASRDTA